MKLESYPDALIKNREMIEASFIFSLYKDTSLYGDYSRNIKLDIEDGDIRTTDGIFYYSVGLQMFKLGYQNFDNLSISTFLESNQVLKDGFESRGGYKPIEEMKSLINIENVETYHDELVKNNMLLRLHDKGFNVVSNIDKFKKMTSEEVYMYYDYLLNNININTGNTIQIETLEIDDKFIEECNEGSSKGIDYGKVCHILNYLTLGLPLSDMYLVGGHSGIGKSSFVFGNIIMPVAENGVKCCIISNEQKSKDFKNILLSTVLAKDLNYYDLTRKKIKIGNFTPEQLAKIYEAKDKIKEKYSSIKFVKLFDYSVNKVKKIVKKLSKQGYQIFLYDTFKSDDLNEGESWKTIVEDSKQLFQLASKENVCIIPTYQLALHSLNKRYLDATCLSNAKQIKEVFSEMIYLRPVWEDEFEGQKYDIKPFNFKKDSNGKYTKIKETYVMNPEKKYLIVFLDKTRNDEDKQTILYEFNGRYNLWKEVGYCSPFHDRS